VIYEIGNFIGSGAAGVVYDCYSSRMNKNYALKILNPLGYRVSPPVVLTRCEIMTEGRYIKSNLEELSQAHIWWLRNKNTNELIAATCFESSPKVLNNFIFLSFFI